MGVIMKTHSIRYALFAMAAVVTLAASGMAAEAVYRDVPATVEQVTEPTLRGALERHSPEYDRLPRSEQIQAFESVYADLNGGRSLFPPPVVSEPPEPVETSPSDLFRPVVEGTPPVRGGGGETGPSYTPPPHPLQEDFDLHYKQQTGPGHLNPEPLVPNHPEPRHLEPRHLDPAPLEPRHLEPQRLEPRHLEPRRLEPRHLDPPKLTPKGNHMRQEPLPEEGY